MRLGYSLRRVQHQRRDRALWVRDAVTLVLPCGHEVQRSVGRGYGQRRAQCEHCGPDRPPEQLRLVEDEA